VLAPGERPDPSRPEGTDRLPQIGHVVVLMMENHSYDSYLGALDRGDGFSRGAGGSLTNANPDGAGNPVRAFHMANTCQLPGRPSQAWNATHQQWDNGAMDGFVRSPSGPVAMGYWTGADLPVYYGLASTFPLCDRWFGSCMGQTYPNRRFLLAATARGEIRDDLGAINGPLPPNGTIMDALNRHGVPWRNYYSTLPTTGLFLPVLQANGDKVVKVDQFFADAARGTLPAFALVDPDFSHGSEENSQDVSLGESFAARVVNAVMSSPSWPKTVLIWCYDEHGGYYDHVPPPPAVAPDDVQPKLGPGDAPGGYDRYGFRVPGVVVSPWARKRYVSSVVHDHTSVLRLIEAKFNLPALTARDAHADDLLDCLDLSGTPPFRTPPALPAPRNPDGKTPLCTGAGAVPNPAG
jgi:phospholipase C